MNAIKNQHPGGDLRTLVVCPTYNEREMLPLFLERFAETGLECLIVDDASPDGTGEWADRFAADHPWCHVLDREGKDGLGAAYRAGFEWALERGYDAIGQMDCDLSHPPETLAQMVGEIEAGAGLCLGSRYVRGGGTDGWPIGRRVMSRAGCVSAQLVLALPYPDLSGGFKMWSAAALRQIEISSTVSNGYVFQVETTQRAHRAGVAISQVPFVFRERVVGESKMSGAIAIEGARVLVRLRTRRWRPELRAA
jgi:dolichol-phosphate mannosyltransferase